jgi:hypothetical protein
MRKESVFGKPSTEVSIDPEIPFGDWLARNNFQPYHANWRMESPQWIQTGVNPTLFSTTELFNRYKTETQHETK